MISPSILVAESVQPTDDIRKDLERAPSSNVNGHLLAPGFDVTSLSGVVRVQIQEGTSLAASHVTGAAAWLLSLNPNLSNAALRSALLAQDGPSVAGTDTRQRLYVPKAIQAINVLTPGARELPGGKLLADMDDGTVDGFTRVTRNDAGQITDYFYAGERDFSINPRVDMADFRYFRDSAFMQYLGDSLGCDPQTPACDLNADGRVNNPSFPEEFLRAQIVQGASSLPELQSQWDSDPIQGWSRDDLPHLLNSADVLIIDKNFLTCAQTDQIKVTLGGDAPTPDDRLTNPNALIDIPVDTHKNVLTTPLTDNMKMTVTVVGGRKDGMTFTDVPIGTHHGGEDVATILNPAALDDPGAPLITDTPGECHTTTDGGGSGMGGGSGWTCSDGAAGTPSAQTTGNASLFSYLSSPPVPEDTTAQDVIHTCGSGTEPCPLSQTCTQWVQNAYSCPGYPGDVTGCNFTSGAVSPYLLSDGFPGTPSNSELCGYQSVYKETCYATNLSREDILKYYDCQLNSDPFKQHWAVSYVDGGHDLIFHKIGGFTSSKVLVTYDLGMFCIQDGL